jgi:hypothetical protein
MAPPARPSDKNSISEDRIVLRAMQANGGASGLTIINAMNGVHYTKIVAPEVPIIEEKIANGYILREDLENFNSLCTIFGTSIPANYTGVGAIVNRYNFMIYRDELAQGLREWLQGIGDANDITFGDTDYWLADFENGPLTELPNVPLTANSKNDFDAGTYYDCIKNILENLHSYYGIEATHPYDTLQKAKIRAVDDLTFFYNYIEAQGKVTTFITSLFNSNKNSINQAETLELVQSRFDNAIANLESLSGLLFENAEILLVDAESILKDFDKWLSLVMSDNNLSQNAISSINNIAETLRHSNNNGEDYGKVWLIENYNRYLNEISYIVQQDGGTVPYHRIIEIGKKWDTIYDGISDGVNYNLFSIRDYVESCGGNETVYNAMRNYYDSQQDAWTNANSVEELQIIIDGIVAELEAISGGQTYDAWMKGIVVAEIESVRAFSESAELAALADKALADVNAATDGAEIGRILDEFLYEAQNIIYLTEEGKVLILAQIENEVLSGIIGSNTSTFEEAVEHVNHWEANGMSISDAAIYKNYIADVQTYFDNILTPAITDAESIEEFNTAANAFYDWLAEYRSNNPLPIYEG